MTHLTPSYTLNNNNKKNRAEMAAVASCQWWLTFPTPFQWHLWSGLPPVFPYG